MTLTRKFAALAASAICTATLTTAALADGIVIDDAYARASNTRAGAAFVMIHNHGTVDDRLVSVSSDAAARVELHTHKEIGDGVFKMMEIEDGFAIPAGGMHGLARGGDHVMFMGLTAPFEQGAVVSVTLTFEQAGDVVVDIPVDLERQPAKDAHAGH